MMNYLKVNRIPKIKDSLLYELAKEIKPLLYVDGTLFHIKQKPLDADDLEALRTQSFIWDAKKTSEAGDYAKIGTIITYHTFGASVFFKPSIAEVIAQIQSQLSSEQLKQVRGFSVEGDLNSYHVLTDGYHFTKTHLYEKLILGGSDTDSLRPVVGRELHGGVVVV